MAPASFGEWHVIRGVDYAEREGGRHTVACVGEAITVPRHREINEMTARNTLWTVEEWL